MIDLTEDDDTPTCGNEDYKGGNSGSKGGRRNTITTHSKRGSRVSSSQEKYEENFTRESIEYSVLGKRQNEEGEEDLDDASAESSGDELCNFRPSIVF